MKILITTDAYVPMINGVVISVMNLKEQLVKRGHEVKILALSDTGRARKEGDVYYLPSIPFPIYPDARVTFSFYGEYVKELIDWKPDLVHSQSEFTSLCAAKRIAKNLNNPVIHTYHTMYEDYTHYFVKSKRVGKKMVSWLARILLGKVDVIVTPTRKVSDALKGYGLNRPMVSIPTGIDLSRFTGSMESAERDGLRAGLGFGKEDKVLVFVGRVGKEKNIDFVVSQLKGLMERDRTLRMAVVGDGPHKKELEELVKNLGLAGQVVFTGAVKPEQVHRYYKAADVFVNASESETQGLTYIEALASGIPAVCKMDECLKGVIEDGYNGYLFEDGQELAECVKRIFADRAAYDRLSENAQKSVLRFSKEEFGRRMEKLYQFVLMKKSTAEK